ncbi:MAG: hypothetical protein LWY06_14985 [Firmicutes bacterium]|nr:hypothetical protein [Bacillota bacterium]
MTKRSAGVPYLYLFIAAIILAFSTPVFAVEAPGNIFYESKGKLWTIQPDKAGERVISEKCPSGNGLLSPDGKQFVFPVNNAIYSVNLSDKQEKLLYEGEKGKEMDLYSWIQGMEGFVFRINKGKDIFDYFQFKESDNKAVNILEAYEPPFLSDDGKFWAYTTYRPGMKSDESQIYAAEIGTDKKQFVFQGRRKEILGWDKENSVVLYTMFDKIYAFDLVHRQRQIINLPFKEIIVFAYNKSGIMYYNKNQEEKETGIMLFDPQKGEQKGLVEGKKTAFVVTYNQDLSKLIFFVPQNPANDMGEGELYLFESDNATVVKLTRDRGDRVVKEKNLALQWSPDGKYFVYEKVRMKHGDVKKSEIWIAGDGKNEQLRKQAGNPVWGVIK